MSFHQVNGVRYFSFQSLPDESVIQAIFTRHGGVSPSPWYSLNLGSTVGDRPENVSENRRRALETVGIDPASVFDVWQIHSAKIVVADQPWLPSAGYESADGILTNRQGVTLLMRFADCVPVMLFDPRHRAVGLVHAGWKGTVRKAVVRAVKAMTAAYGSSPGDLWAGIGPSIGPDHYEIGDDVGKAVEEAFPQTWSQLLSQASGRLTFDLWQANLALLQGLGVKNIDVSGLCTGCHLEDWYSHRGEHGETGRFGALIALR